MNIKYLFSNKYKNMGWMILIPAVVIGLYSILTNYEPEFLDFELLAIINTPFMGETQYFDWIKNNILNEIVGILTILGLILIAFSKEKKEDEFITKIRLESLVWAVYVNYIILALSFLFIFEFTFLWVMLLNMFTILIFFIIRFYWQLNKLKRISRDEE